MKHTNRKGLVSTRKQCNGAVFTPGGHKIRAEDSDEGGAAIVDISLWGLRL